MNKLLTAFIALFVSFFSWAQAGEDIITEAETSRIIHILASDSLKGRGNGQPGVLKAAKFIGEEFKNIGLSFLPPYPNYYFPFYPDKTYDKDQLTWNGKRIPFKEFIYLPVIPGSYAPKSLADFKIIKANSFFTEDILEKQGPIDQPLLIWTDQLQPKGKKVFPPRIPVAAGGLKQAVLFVYAKVAPVSLKLVATPAYSKLLYNVVGILPGKSKPNEVILFSAHYDHFGVGRNKKDSIMNGANDNASGTTAMLMLARYFAARNDNERTLVFCAFSGEELGLKGSMSFINYINLDRIIADVNIEMIGIPQYGKKTVFITGAENSSFADIIAKNVTKEELAIIPDPDPDKNLYKRSDNYVFVRVGKIGHSIMASDDTDKCYHEGCDEVGRLDISNMTDIIRAIAKATRTLVNGEDKPKKYE